MFYFFGGSTKRFEELIIDCDNKAVSMSRISAVLVRTGYPRRIVSISIRNAVGPTNEFSSLLFQPMANLQDFVFFLFLFFTVNVCCYCFVRDGCFVGAATSS